jgi:hypothetical protein
MVVTAGPLQKEAYGVMRRSTKLAADGVVKVPGQ